MNLCIDQGNSCTKIAVFHGDEIVFKQLYETIDCSILAEIQAEFPVKTAILSSVSETSDEVLKYLRNQFSDFIFFDHQTKLPIDSDYTTPETLGKDRVAAVVGAWSIQPETNLLVVDVGTAITYDFIDKTGLYVGGDITPGIMLRLKSLHQFTRNLPLVDFDADVSFLGKNTQSAIQSGVLYGVVSEIDGYINLLQEKYKELSVFLTGGGAVYFEKRLKSIIFANANLVLIGLNRILKYNVESI